jgi:ubiquinone/menaquinone biosynthesis C-methylase UbiE
VRCLSYSVSKVRSFDRAASVYDATRSLPEEVMRRTIASLVMRLGRPSRILDLGVGTGRFAVPLREHGFDVVGLDVSRKMLTVGRKKGLHDLVQSVAQRTPFRNDAFHTTLMVHFIHLVEDWPEVLREIARVTTERVIAVVNESSAPKMRQRYLELLEERGISAGGARTGEKEISTISRPIRRSMLVKYVEKVDLDDEVARFVKRESAITWDVPRRIHSDVVKQMEREYRGKVRARKSLLMLEWRAKSLWRGVKLPSP